MKDPDIKITDKIISEHGLTKEEFERIVKTLGRRPNIVELGMYSVLWSEHCSYKSSRSISRNSPQSRPGFLRVPERTPA